VANAHSDSQRFQNPENAAYCVDWTVDREKNYGFATTSLELPASANVLFFLARDVSSGQLNFVSTPDNDKDVILVNITALYNRHSDLDNTKVCRMGSSSIEGGEHGLLILGRTPDPELPRDCSAG
jgi:hypothetical protein